jgi:methylase of polypeptide subunit release factors
MNPIKYTQDQIKKSKEISKQNMDIQNPSVFELCGERFLIMPHVFSPQLFPSAKIYYPKFPYREEDGFLEIGCGAGYGSVFAAKKGARRVVATDINPAAIENTRLNCELHKVEDRVEVIGSDLFTNIQGTYSTIYWNHPFITAPEGYVFANVVERAIFDPGYKLLHSFVSNARQFLAPNGRVLVGLADVGGLDYFRELANQYGYLEKELLREVGVEGNQIEVTLHELTPKV